MTFVKVYPGPVVTATATTYTIDPGEQIPAGSVLVAAISINGPNDCTLQAPDGTWTTVQHASSGGGIIAAAFIKSVTTAETVTYQFSNSIASARVYQGGIALYSSRDITTPVHRSDKVDLTATSSTSIDLPALASNPTINGCDIIRIGAIANGTTTAAITMPNFERGEWISGGAVAKRPVAISDTKQVTAAAVGATTATTTAATTTSRVGITIALAPATTISSNGPEYVDAVANATGIATGITWAPSTANVLDTSDTSVSTFAVPANATDYGSFFSHNAADWTDLPADAQIEDVSVTVTMRAQTASRLTAWLRQESANNTAIGIESTINAGAALSTTLTGFTLTASADFGQVPTRAQLVTGTYGFRLRVRRSNAVTAELASVKTTVTYSVSSTTFTSTHNATATISPTHQIVVTRRPTHNATATVAPTHAKQAQVQRTASVTGAPTHTKQARLARSQTATVSPTHTKQPQIARTASVTASPTHTASKVILRTHNATVTGAATHTKQAQLARTAAVSAAPTHKKDVALARAFVETVSATHASTKVTLRSHNASATVSPTHTKQPQIRRTANAAGAATHLKRPGISRTASAAVTPSQQKAVSLARSVLETVAPTAQSVKAFLRTHSVTATVTPTHVKQARLLRAQVAQGTPTHQMFPRLTRSAQGTVLAAHAKAVSLTRARLASISATHSSSKVTLRSHNALATVSATAAKSVRLAHIGAVSPIATDRRHISRAVSATAIATATHAYQHIRPPVLLTHSVTATVTPSHSRDVLLRHTASVSVDATHDYHANIIGSPAPHRRPRTRLVRRMVRAYSTPKASVGNEGDYGGARVYSRARANVRVTARPRISVSGG